MHGSCYVENLKADNPNGQLLAAQPIALLLLLRLRL